MATSTSTKSGVAALELGMQELEAMDAPGWWTAAGVFTGAAATYASIYFAVSGAAIT